MKRKPYINEEDMPSRPRRRWIWPLTACVLVVTILLNVGVGVLFDHNRWFVDNTLNKYVQLPYKMYTLSKQVAIVIRTEAEPAMNEINAKREQEGKEPIATEIIFCADRDRLEASDEMRYILYTALALQKQFDWIKVSFCNVEKNPSSVQQYKATSATHIYSTDVIVACGSEYLVEKGSEFFSYDDDEIWAYDGERTFASAILAVTCAEAPIACLTVNHGEPIEQCTALIEVIEGAGYRVQTIDLDRDEIPADCRLIVTYDPQTDFYGYGNVGVDANKSEIDKLDAFLDKALSFMLFVDNETPELPNLEEYMREWGVNIRRATDADGGEQNYHIKDTVTGIDGAGYTPLGVYATGGLGGAVTSDMREAAAPAPVIFPNATALGMSDSYTLTYQEADDVTGKPEFAYGHYYKNGIQRNMDDVFTAGENAVAEIDGKTYEVTTQENVFKLMTITAESRTIQESNYYALNDESYVCVCASTEFASNEALSSAAYGNADVLYSALRSMGGEVLPVKVDLFKPLQETDVIYVDLLPSHPLVVAAIMIAIPIVASTVAGIWVTVRRKHR